MTGVQRGVCAWRNCGAAVIFQKHLLYGSSQSRAVWAHGAGAQSGHERGRFVVATVATVPAACARKARRKTLDEFLGKRKGAGWCRYFLMIGGGERETAQVVIKPIGEAAAIAGKVGPSFTAVFGAGFYDESCGGAGGGGAGDVELGLLNRHEWVGVAVDDERRGRGGTEVAGRGKGLA